MKKIYNIILVILVIIFILSIPFIAPNANNTNSLEYIESDDISNNMIKNITFESFIGKMLMTKDYYVPVELSYKNNSFPSVNVSNNLEKLNDYDYDVYTLSKDNNYDKIIFYIHGGGYVYPISKEHVYLCDELATKTNSKVYMPLYGLVHNSTYKEAYNFLTEVYIDLLKENKTIIIMGDSAGGGLALGFTEYLKESNFTQPSKQVLMSPWVDLTLSNRNIKYFDQYDIMLSSFGAIKWGEKWAGNLNRSDYKVSPINGNLSNLPETLLFASDSEMLFPDISKLYEKMSVNSTVHYVVAENMVHVYPLFNTTAGIMSREKMVNFINN